MQTETTTLDDDDFDRIDTDKLDMNALLDPDRDTDIHASEELIGRICKRVDHKIYPQPDPADYDSQGRWLEDCLFALFVRAQLDVGMGVFEISHRVQHFDEEMRALFGDAIEEQAEQQGYETELRGSMALGGAE